MQGSYNEGLLTTEQYSNKTIGLSDMAKNNLAAALSVLKEMDTNMLNKLAEHEAALKELKEAVQASLAAGRKVYISGCGAAGRAGELVAKLFADAFPAAKDRVIPIMAGGEGALVRAAEGFEDNAEYGKRQLREAGFQPGDLLIALSASGSASFLYGQLEYAASEARDHGGQKPYFHICNSYEEVAAKFADKALFKDPSLNAHTRFVSTNTGPMALAGSTRMQAATVQVLCVGIALLNIEIKPIISALQRQLEKTALNTLIPMIEHESSFYRRHEGVYYLASANAGLTVLTDTTERSPTFSLPYFENDHDPIEEKRNNHPLCRVMIKNCAHSAEAWKAILGREPKALNWDEKTSMERLLGNNISTQISEIRRTYIDVKHHILEVELNEPVISLKLDDKLLAHFELDELASLPSPARDLAEQIFLKILLNDASTLIAGRLGLYESNLMTNVRPSNMKLIDRAKRLTYALIEQAGQQADASPALKAYIADPDKLKSLISEIFDQQRLIEDPKKAVVARTKDAVLAAIARGSDANLTVRGGFAEASSGAAEQKPHSLDAGPHCVHPE